MPSLQARYWILTIPHHLFVPWLPQSCVHVQGQLESGHQDGYLHWQVAVAFRAKTSLQGVREAFGPVHAEPSRSGAVRAYCWKQDTRVEGILIK